MTADVTTWPAIRNIPHSLGARFQTTQKFWERDKLNNQVRVLLLSCLFQKPSRVKMKLFPHYDNSLHIITQCNQ